MMAGPADLFLPLLGSLRLDAGKFVKAARARGN